MYAQNQETLEFETSMQQTPLVSGLRFSPDDSELFCHYLYGKIKGTLLPDEFSLVRLCNLYGEEEPWRVWERHGAEFLTYKDDLYFFTMLKKKNGDDSKRVDRNVGADRAGTWSGEDSGERFQFVIVNDSSGDDTGIPLQAIKKRFRYENPRVPEQNGRWIMHEYSLPSESPNWVLCRLRKNRRANPVEVEEQEEDVKKTTKRQRNETKERTKSAPRKRNKIQTEIQLQKQEPEVEIEKQEPEANLALATAVEKSESTEEEVKNQIVTSTSSSIDQYLHELQNSDPGNIVEEVVKNQIVTYDYGWDVNVGEGGALSTSSSIDQNLYELQKYDPEKTVEGVLKNQIETDDYGWYLNVGEDGALSVTSSIDQNFHELQNYDPEKTVDGVVKNQIVANDYGWHLNVGEDCALSTSSSVDQNLYELQNYDPEKTGHVVNTGEELATATQALNVKPLSTDNAFPDVDVNRFLIGDNDYKFCSYL